MSENAVIQLLPVIEGAIRDAFESCDTIESAGALWAALSKVTAESAGESVKRLGGEPDQMREALDRFFLHNPS